jgi:hypothetical protein
MTHCSILSKVAKVKPHLIQLSRFLSILATAGLNQQHSVYQTDFFTKQILKKVLQKFIVTINSSKF